MSIPSEKYFFLYCSIFIIPKNTRLNKFVDLTIIVNMCSFNNSFNGKLLSVSNLIFRRFSPYLPSLPPLTVLISFLIPSQSSVYFFNTSLFSSVKSKAKYLLPILYIHTCIYLHSSVVYYYKYCHLVYIYTYTFHAILCVLFH